MPAGTNVVWRVLYDQQNHGLHQNGQKGNRYVQSSEQTLKLGLREKTNYVQWFYRPDGYHYLQLPAKSAENFNDHGLGSEILASRQMGRNRFAGPCLKPACPRPLRPAVITRPLLNNTNTTQRKNNSISCDKQRFGVQRNTFATKTPKPLATEPPLD